MGRPLMLVKIIVGVAIVIGTILVLGPMGLLLLVPAVLLVGWIFGNEGDPEKNAEHKRNVDRTFNDMFGGGR